MSTVQKLATSWAPAAVRKRTYAFGGVGSMPAEAALWVWMWPGVQVTQRNLAEVSIAAGISLKNATAIVMSPEQKGLQLSSYTAGLICQNLLGKYDLIFDYERNRVGVVTQIGQSPLGHEAAKAG